MSGSEFIRLATTPEEAAAYQAAIERLQRDLTPTTLRLNGGKTIAHIHHVEGEGITIDLEDGDAPDSVKVES